MLIFCKILIKEIVNKYTIAEFYVVLKFKDAKLLKKGLTMSFKFSKGHDAHSSFLQS